MSDEIDLANDVINTILAAQIEYARKPQETLRATGFCLFCGDPLTDQERRWCDADCRDDWERDNRDVV